MTYGESMDTSWIAPAQNIINRLEYGQIIDGQLVLNDLRGIKDDVNKTRLVENVIEKSSLGNPTAEELADKFTWPENSPLREQFIALLKGKIPRYKPSAPDVLGQNAAKATTSIS
jgi:hypothetical protein